MENKNQDRTLIEIRQAERYRTIAIVVLAFDFIPLGVAIVNAVVYGVSAKPLLTFVPAIIGTIFWFIGGLYFAKYMAIRLKPEVRESYRQYDRLKGFG